MRKTSLMAYNTIKDNGLLSLRRFEVYDDVFYNGPTTCRQTVKRIAGRKGASVSITYSSYSSRFSELERSGVIEEVGKVIDAETGHLVISWDVTGRLPLTTKATKEEKLVSLRKECASLKKRFEIKLVKYKELKREVEATR